MNYELMNKVSKITLQKNYKEEDLDIALEDLLDAYEELKKEFENYKRNVEENYRKIPYSIQVGIYDKDFI